jgi:hypothetical protein
MSKEPSERKAYRKSPGRQYGYDYDPLRTQNDAASRSGSLSTRPNPRRTRQLLRKNILAGKRPSEAGDEEIDALEPEYIESPEQEMPYNEEMMPTTPYSRRHPEAYPYTSSDEGLEETWQDDEAFDDELEPVDEGLDYGEYVDDDLNQGSRRSNRPRGRSIAARTRILPEETYDEEADYEEEESPAPASRRKRRKSKMSRRGLLFGAGAALVGTTAVVTYELGPKLPQAANEIGSTLEHQLQDAFNKGVAQGAEQARREIVTAMDNLEGFTLDGAISAARLTRVAYDVFVSPVVHFGSALTGDFLSGMLSALKTARGWLAGAYQDNASLAAIQKVLESWVSQVTSMPKQLDAITQTDLDGAQGYLRALQTKLNEEKAKLNNPSSTTNTTNTQNAQSTPQPTQPKK